MGYHESTLIDQKFPWKPVLRTHVCPTCGATFKGADQRFCPDCHRREHDGSPLGSAREPEAK